jgi:hypothetical protein
MKRLERSVEFGERAKALHGTLGGPYELGVLLDAMDGLDPADRTWEQRLRRMEEDPLNREAGGIIPTDANLFNTLERLGVPDPKAMASWLKTGNGEMPPTGSGPSRDAASIRPASPIPQAVLVVLRGFKEGIVTIDGAARMLAGAWDNPEPEPTPRRNAMQVREDFEEDDVAEAVNKRKWMLPVFRRSG